MVKSGRRLPAAALVLLDAVPDCVLVCDERAAIVHLHPIAERLLGITNAEAFGQDLGRQVLSLDGRPFSGARLGELIRRGGDGQTTLVLRHRSGAQIRTLLGASAATIDGFPLWFLSLRPYPVAQPAPLDHDVYRAIFERSPVGLCHTDAHGTVTAVNETFAASIGAPRRVLLGLDVRSLPDREMVAEYERALAGEVVRSQRHYVSATGGRAADVELVIAPIYDDADQLTGVVTISTDVTAQVQARQALERSHGALHRLMESAPDAIAVLREGRYAMVNSRTVEMLGAASAEELIGRHVADLVDPEDHALLGRRLAAPRPDLPPAEYRMRRLADGRQVRVEVKSLAFEYEGEPGLLVFGRDVTERRELEARLSQADRMASVGTLAAGVAHEINNPLAYVIMTVSVLADRARRGLLEPADLVHDLESVLEGAERIRTIVRDLSTFSRRADDVMTSVDVNQVIEAAANMVRHQLRYRARLVLELAPGLAPVRGDPARLTQVLVNLLVNAAQAIPEGHAGEHVVAVRSGASPGGGVRVSVRDDGEGMAPQVAQRIFEPFFTTKAPGVGTGLGLSICHNIVRGHGGTIHAASEPGRGSEFVVELPAEPALRAEPHVAAAAPVADAAPAAPAHILIIDDESAFVGVLRNALGTRHEVRVAHGGRQGLAALHDGPAPDMILCDLMMPDLTGMDVLESLSAERPTLAERFVFMTGGAVTERARATLASTTRPVLAKPFATEDVERVLRALRPPAAT